MVNKEESIRIKSLDEILNHIEEVNNNRFNAFMKYSNNNIVTGESLRDKYLLEEYPGFKGKRIKDLPKDLIARHYLDDINEHLSVIQEMRNTFDSLAPDWYDNNYITNKIKYNNRDYISSGKNHAVSLDKNFISSELIDINTGDTVNLNELLGGHSQKSILEGDNSFDAYRKLEELGLDVTNEKIDALEVYKEFGMIDEDFYTGTKNARIEEGKIPELNKQNKKYEYDDVSNKNNVDEILEEANKKWNSESEIRRQQELDDELRKINEKYDAELKEELDSISKNKNNNLPKDDIEAKKQKSNNSGSNQNKTQYEHKGSSSSNKSNHTEYKASPKVKQPTIINETDDILFDAVSKAENVTGFTNKFAKGAIGLVAGASLLHAGMSHLEDKKAENMMKEQNKKIDKQREEEYEETVRRRNATQGMYYNLNQQLFANRTGHTNTWGGKRY